MALRFANLSPVWLSTFGSSSLVWVGNSVRVLLPIRRWTGEVPKPSDGVVLQSKNASRGSLLSARAFFSSALQTPVSRRSPLFRSTEDSVGLRSCAQISTSRRNSQIQTS